MLNNWEIHKYNEYCTSALTQIRSLLVEMGFGRVAALKQS